MVRRQCASARGRRVPVARVLMDQSKTSGIGNYVLSETLYLARVHPWATCADLDDDEWEAVHAAATDVIGRSYASQAALAAAERVSATRGRMQFKLHAYRRRVDDEGLAVAQAVGPHGRSVFWVPQRQTRGAPAEPSGTAAS